MTSQDLTAPQTMGTTIASDAIDFRKLAEMISLTDYLTHARARGASPHDAISALLISPKGIAALRAGRGKRAARIALDQRAAA